MSVQDILINKEGVIDLIPQKAPFVMVDKLISASKESTKSGLFITSDNIFTIDGEFTEPGLVENIAQTCALGAGYEFSKITDENAEPPVGFIGAIKGLKIYQLPTEGQELETTVTVQNQVFDITLVKGETRCNGEVIAECEMKIFVQNSGDLQPN
jgi:3-hydroxyacyl-[acyl-carrier-protein] dehydratase